MPRNTRTGLLFDVGTVATVALDDFGWYGVRVGGYGGPESGLGDAELQCAYGFASRPVDRGEDGKGCDVLYAHAGNSETFAWFGRDARYVDKCPPLTQGSSAQWNHKGAFHLLDSDSDSSMLYVPRGSSAHAVTVGGDADGKDLIELRHSKGGYINCTEADEWTIRGIGNAFINIRGDKIALNGETTVTANFNVGGVTGQPVVNATTLNVILGAMAAALSNLTPITPYEIGLHASLLALVAAFPTTYTQMLKAV